MGVTMSRSPIEKNMESNPQRRLCPIHKTLMFDVNEHNDITSIQRYECFEFGCESTTTINF